MPSRPWPAAASEELFQVHACIELAHLGLMMRRNGISAVWHHRLPRHDFNQRVYNYIEKLRHVAPSADWKRLQTMVLEGKADKKSIAAILGIAKKVMALDMDTRALAYLNDRVLRISWQTSNCPWQLLRDIPSAQIPYLTKIAVLRWWLDAERDDVLY
jgi:hypothetical protein